MQKSRSVSVYTLFGLFFAFLVPSIVIIVFRWLSPDMLNNTFVTVRELALFLVTGILLLLIIRGEKLNLDTIGLHNKHWGKSILWSFIIMVVFIIVVLGCLTLFKYIGITYGQSEAKYDHISLWVITFMMLRAGILEEIFYRGYAMERLHSINANWLVYFLFPSVMFGLMHYQQGIGGVIIATAGGLVMSYFYWKRRDLKANILAHCMIDLIPNVLVPLISGDY